jgi:hypothetical protein
MNNRLAGKDSKMQEVNYIIGVDEDDTDLPIPRAPSPLVGAIFLGRDSNGNVYFDDGDNIWVYNSEGHLILKKKHPEICEDCVHMIEGYCKLFVNSKVDIVCHRLKSLIEVTG